MYRSSPDCILRMHIRLGTRLKVTGDFRVRKTREGRARPTSQQPRTFQFNLHAPVLRCDGRARRMGILIILVVDHKIQTEQDFM